MLAPGQEYRRRWLHEQFGGQRQGGVSTPAREPVVLLFTGESGKDYGYSDGWDGGVFLYTGEGQVGDMRFTKGNAAIRDHADRGKDLLLFRDCGRGFVLFVGPMVYAGHEFRIAPDKSGQERRTILFRLAPVGDFSDPGGLSDTERAELAAAESMSLEELRRRATEDSEVRPKRRERRTEYMRRSEWVRRYALRRAAGRCAGCSSPAPFSTADGAPYLEVHQTLRLSDGGPDDPDAVIAVCPNCHRRAHYGNDADTYNTRLRSVAATR